MPLYLPGQTSQLPETRADLDNAHAQVLLSALRANSALLNELRGALVDLSRRRNPELLERAMQSLKGLSEQEANLAIHSAIDAFSKEQSLDNGQQIQLIRKVKDRIRERLQAALDS